jgi:putative spermidine/putrescine transport system substrate-binding protein
MELKRRDFLVRAATAGVTAGALPFAHEAWAKESLTIVEWGNPYLDAAKKVAAKWDQTDITWALHSGGASAVLAKIKASWPNPPYDIVTNWSAGFETMAQEGWAETITLADVPNLADVPPQFVPKDDKGNVKAVPRSIDGSFFAVRTDRCPIEIKTLEDLLNPKLKGMIAWPGPTVYSNAALLAAALGRGGSLQNLEPGWKFVEELAKTGNIGRVYQGSVELTNAISTGEACITYTANGPQTALVKMGLPMKSLTKIDASLKACLYVEAYVVMTSSKQKKAALQFVNFATGQENSELFHQNLTSLPANQKAKPGGNVSAIQFTSQEHAKFVEVPNWSYMGTQLDAWTKRWERDIAPKI